MLLPGTQRVTLYQIPSVGGGSSATATARWSCAARARNSSSSPTTRTTPLRDCEPYAVLPPPEVTARPRAAASPPRDHSPDRRRHRRRRHGHGRRREPAARRLCDARPRHPARGRGRSDGAGRRLRPFARGARPRVRRRRSSLVVDAPQVETVLFGAGGAAAALPAGHVVLLASTVDPDFVAALAPRLARARRRARRRAGLGRPEARGRRHDDDDGRGRRRRAAHAARRCSPRSPARVFAGRLARRRRGQVQDRQQPAGRREPGRGRGGAGARRKAGLDPATVVDVVNASSGGSWIFADRMPRALAGDYAPRAAARILAKDVGIAVEFARRHRRRRAVRARRRTPRSRRPSPPGSASRTTRRSTNTAARARAFRVDEGPAVRRPRCPRLQSKRAAPPGAADTQGALR